MWLFVYQKGKPIVFTMLFVEKYFPVDGNILFHILEIKLKKNFKKLL